VVDLGFGDAGKGTMTDWLVRKQGASAVVRFNGGAQAGHNVVTEDGRHHTFSQLGAGSFVPGVRTFLSKHVVFHPTALLVEAGHLARVGVPDALDRVVVSEDCLVTTPLHQAATCIRELVRTQRHGSCGVGVGETMRDSIASPHDAIRARDLRDPERLRRWLLRLQRDKREELHAELQALPSGDLADAQRDALEDARVIEAWLACTREVLAHPIVQDDSLLHGILTGPEAVVFEGAQGVLLDEWRGFHPFTTWSTCTFDNALALLAEHGSPFEPFRLGVLRSFATRHGAGPFPTESHDLPPARTREHNDAGPWQGAFRVGAFDAVLSRYAIEACGGVDGLALTHLDRFAGGEPWRFAGGYEVPSTFASMVKSDAGTAQVAGLKVGELRDLVHTERLGQTLFHARPVMDELAAPDATPIVAKVEALLRAPVVLTSHGPTARDKRETSRLCMTMDNSFETGRGASGGPGRVPPQRFEAKKQHMDRCTLRASR